MRASERLTAHARLVLIATALVWTSGCVTTETTYTGGTCSATGGTFVGYPAVKFLRGDIDDDVYRSEDGFLTVELPHKRGSYEYRFTRMVEGTEDFGVSVNFGPAAWDRGLYKVEGVRRDTPGYRLRYPRLEDFESEWRKNFELAMTETLGAALVTEIESRRETIAGRPAYYSKLYQNVTEPKFAFQDGATVVNHEIFVIDFADKGFAVVSVSTPDLPVKFAIDPPPIDTRAFAESIELN